MAAYRELYLNTLLFSNPARVPFEPGGPRKSTLERWRREGLPEGVNWLDYICDKIGMSEPPRAPNPNAALPAFAPDFRMIPWYEEKILEHRNGRYIIQDWMGAVLEISDKYDYTYIRNAVDFVTRRWIKNPVENREDWAEMKKRYNPETASRVPALSAAETALLNARGDVLTVQVNGPFWQLREWLGFEQLCMSFLDAPAFVAEMIEFWREYVLRVFERAFSTGVQIDGVCISEDMAYKAHSMISPAMTREYLLPVYKKWAAFFKSNGVAVVDMDSDGYVAELIPIWIEAGINVSDPVEVAAHNDIVAYRDTYGGRMAYRGGIDKRAIARGGAVIEAEINRVSPVIESGGYIPSCDHGVPGDISLDNFIYYARLLARRTGWLS